MGRGVVGKRGKAQSDFTEVTGEDLQGLADLEGLVV
jgi:hypothetical protein